MEKNTGMVISYRTMRRAIGILGMLLPFAVVLLGFIQTPFAVLPSISDYYYVSAGVCFVGLMCAVALFLISYKGYDTLDNVVTNLSGAFALFTAFFPTNTGSVPPQPVGVFQLPDNVSGYIHLSFAALFFIALAFNSIVLFTKGSQPIASSQKRKRNTLYVTCGLVMLACLLAMVLYFLFWRDTFLASLHPVLILEAIALWAFGLSWLVKGETLFRDR